MEMENQLLLRRAYSKCLQSFVEAMGITVVRHSKIFLHMIDSYLEQYDGPVEIARLNTIKTLSVYIQVTWPRVPSHCERILKSMLKFVYDISEDRTLTRQEVKDELVAEATKCLIILKRACCRKVVELLEPMKNDKFNETWHCCVTEILESD
jgi:hypothetical protein